MHRSLFVLTIFTALVGVHRMAEAGPVVFLPGFAANSLAPNDDGSTGLIALPFSVDFFGTTFNSLYVNNNGNVTFDASLGTFTPFDLTSTGRQIIAPFFADVDTRGTGTVTYGVDAIDGLTVFAVTWNAVGYYNGHTSPTNTFQLLLTDRSDTGVGNFDITFNYDQILWETGDASGGSGGLGGSSARAGYANGTGLPGTFYELPGAGVSGAYLDNGPPATSLVQNEQDTQLGRYIFSARNGTIVNPVPEPSTLGLIVSGIALLGFACARVGRCVTLIRCPAAA